MDQPKGQSSLIDFDFDLDNEFWECEQDLEILTQSIQKTQAKPLQDTLTTPITTALDHSKNNGIGSTQNVKPPSAFDRLYTQSLTQRKSAVTNGDTTSPFIKSEVKKREFSPETKKIHLKKEPDPEPSFRSEIKADSFKDNIFVKPEPLPPLQSYVNGSTSTIENTPSKIRAALKELTMRQKPTNIILRTLGYNPTVNFLFDAISYWQRSNNMLPRELVKPPKFSHGNLLQSNLPAWKMGLLQSIAAEVGPDKQVLECLHETLQLLFLPDEKKYGYSRSDQEKKLSSNQLNYQMALVELKKNLESLFGHTRHRLRDLPRKLHTQFHLDKLEVLKSFGECLLRAEGLGRFKDTSFILDIMESADQVLPSLFGETLIGQRGLTDGILLPLCAIVTKYNIPEREQDALPIELASQIPDRVGSSLGRNNDRAPPAFVVARILHFLSLLISKCPPPCLKWFTCLLDDGILLSLLNSDRIDLQDKFPIISMLTRFALLPKMLPVLVQSGAKSSVQCLANLFEWGLNQRLSHDMLFVLGEEIIGYLHVLVTQDPSYLSLVFGYSKDQKLESSILFPLVAFVQWICVAQGSLQQEALSLTKAKSIHPQMVSVDSRATSHGPVFRATGLGATRECDRTVQLFELFLRLLELNIHDKKFYLPLRAQTWIRIRPQSQVAISCLDGMDLFQGLFNLLATLASHPDQQSPLDSSDALVVTAAPSKHGTLYLTQPIKDVAEVIYNFLKKNLKLKTSF